MPLIYRFTPTCVGTTVATTRGLQTVTRFTPTCVGTTIYRPECKRLFFGSPPRAWGQQRPCSSRTTYWTVHPHVRGDNFSHWACGWVDYRFTPTCVGTTIAGRLPAGQVAGSPPRAWGQRLRAAAAIASSAGSPPRAWGQLLSAPSPHPSVSVHPHVRGDNSKQAAHNPDRLHSPPRAWGQRRTHRRRT